GFKSFGDTNGLEAQIDQHKVLGAISSDYHIKKLIKEKKLAKIDYKKIFPNENKTIADFKNLYIDPIIKHKEKPIIDIDNESHEIFDYTIPYYYQYKVIAFDIRRAGPQLVKKLLKERNKDIINNDSRIKDLIRYIDNDEKNWWKNFTNKDISKYLLKDIDGNKIDGKYEYKQYFEILEEIGLKNIVINDYTRDVLYIGASKEKNQEEIAKLENKDYESNFKRWINNFIDNISSYKKNGNIHYTENGTEALTYLSDPNSEYNVAVMYNGDAFDAFNHGDQFKNNNGDNYFIRVIKPKNNFGIFDGLIMPAYIKQDPYYEDKFYEIVRNYFIGKSFDKL
ncbi:MAG: hypothetical protein E7Y34_02325, partial [Mycoplasma sp.]|nr:hypothetical protein [Mycoplasma sp.]